MQAMAIGRKIERRCAGIIAAVPAFRLRSPSYGGQVAGTTSDIFSHAHRMGQRY
jgi:hypothetical protein